MIFGKNENEKTGAERVLEDLRTDVNESAYEASIIMGTEPEYWDKVADLGYAAMQRFHKGNSDVLFGATARDINAVLEECRPNVRKLEWPLQGYTPEKDEAKIKVPPIVAILHGVYDVNKRDIMGYLIAKNPERSVYVRVKPELSPEADLTTKLANDYMRLLYGHKALEEEKEEEKEEGEEEVPHFPLALTKVEEMAPVVPEKAREPKITRAKEAFGRLIRLLRK